MTGRIVPYHYSSQQKKQDNQRYGADLQKAYPAPAGPAAVLETVLEFLPYLLGRAFVQFGFVFFKKIEQTRHVVCNLRPSVQ